MVAAVCVSDEVLVNLVLTNRLDYGNVTRSHGELSLEVNVGGKELNEEPRSENLLLVSLVKDAERRTLRDNLGVGSIYLRNGSDAYLERIVAVCICGRTLVSCTCGRTDGHIALGVILCYEETGGVRAVKSLGGDIALVVPLVELLDERLVLIVVKEEVVTLSCGVGRLVLLTHGDEPVSLGVVSERDGLGVDLLDSCTNSLKLVPGLRNLKVVSLEEGLVVVKNLGGLGERHGVHTTVAELLTFVVVTLDEVSLLSGGETENLGAAVSALYLSGAVDKAVERDGCLCKIVECYVVGIAISDVGLIANGDLGRDLVTNVVIAADLLVLDVDVGIELVELNDVVLKNLTEICTHGVIELDGYFASVVGEGFLNVELVTGDSCISSFAVIGGLIETEVDVTSDKREGSKKHS